jgi:transposase-like protein
MSEDYYTQFCREHTDAETKAFLLDQLRKADRAIAALEPYARIGRAVVEFAKKWREHWDRHHENFMLGELEEVIAQAKEEGSS